MVSEVPPEVLIQRLNEFSKLWHKYMQLFDQALAAESLQPEDEKDFRRLQVEAIRKAQFLSLAVPNKIFDLSKDVKKLFLDTPSLFILKQEVPIRLSAFKTLWHDVSIALNQKQGQLRHYLEEQETSKGRKRK